MCTISLVRLNRCPHQPAPHFRVSKTLSHKMTRKPKDLVPDTTLDWLRPRFYPILSVYFPVPPPILCPSRPAILSTSESAASSSPRHAQSGGGPGGGPPAPPESDYSQFCFNDFEDVWDNLVPLSPEQHDLFPGSERAQDQAESMADTPPFLPSHSLDGLEAALFPSLPEPGQDPMLSSTLEPDEPCLFRNEPHPVQTEDILANMARSLAEDSDQVSDVVIHYLESDSEAGDQDGSDERLSRPQRRAWTPEQTSSADEETEADGRSIHQDHDYLPASPAQPKAHRRGKKRRKPLAHAWSQMKRIGVLQEKKPLYELESFEDPILERCRKNALGAKLNREKKKLEQERIKRELDELRHHNRSLMRRAQQSDARAMKAEQELARMKSLLENRQLSDIVNMSSCSKRHTSLRSREQCVVCSKDAEE